MKFSSSLTAGDTSNQISSELTGLVLLEVAARLKSSEKDSLNVSLRSILKKQSFSLKGSDFKSNLNKLLI